MNRNNVIIVDTKVEQTQIKKPRKPLVVTGVEYSQTKKFLNIMVIKVDIY